MIFIEKLNKNESGLIQLIRMGKSIRHKWVKEVHRKTTRCSQRRKDGPRCDAAKRGVPYWAILFADMIFIEKLNKNESGLIQLIRMGKSMRHKWVKEVHLKTTPCSQRRKKKLGSP